MASVRAIADSIVEWGGDAYLSKLDHKAAFKLVPVRKSIVKYQGFSLLGKYFVETQLVFGACSRLRRSAHVHPGTNPIMDSAHQGGSSTS